MSRAHPAGTSRTRARPRAAAPRAVYNEALRGELTLCKLCGSSGECGHACALRRRVAAAVHRGRCDAARDSEPRETRAHFTVLALRRRGRSLLAADPVPGVAPRRALAARAQVRERLWQHGAAPRLPLPRRRPLPRRAVAGHRGKTRRGPRGRGTGARHARARARRPAPLQAGPQLLARRRAQRLPRAHGLGLGAGVSRSTRPSV